MFESPSKILDRYIKIGDRQLWRFDIYSIWTERGENPEDLSYLCNVHDSWYIVFETDYIHSLEEAAKEAAEIFESGEAKVAHWLIKRDKQGQTGTLPLEVVKDKDYYDKLVFDIEGTYLHCAVLAVSTKGETQKRYNPIAYGFSS